MRFIVYSVYDKTHKSEKIKSKKVKKQ